MTSTQTAQEIIEALLPDKKLRDTCLTIFADATIEANIYGGDKWAIHLLDNKVRLLVGHNIICTINAGRIWMAVDQALLPTAGVDLNQLPEWEWDRKDYPDYPSIEAKNGYYIPSFQHPQIWIELRRLLFEAIYQAATHRKMDARTPNKHNAEVLDYLRRELGRNLPDPSY